MSEMDDKPVKPEYTNDTPLLDGIDSPSDVRALPVERLEQLAKEIRAKILATASAQGGHLAPHLGVVELTLAIHYVFDTPSDLLIWDVGHQCYAHKLITGRREEFDQIRKKGGPAGYPRRSESPYDAFGVGHSSTSISAALGMAVARDQKRERKHVIAVIGDGAITAGMAFEALAHAGHLASDMIVILNDNKMSISPNVGAMSAYFNRLITGGLYNKAKGDVHSFMTKMLGENITKAAQRFEHSVKGFLTPGTIFTELGHKYVGPVDGHCLTTLIECLNNAKELSGPIFFHVVTQKGKGYSYAEEDPLTYHGVRSFDLATGKFADAKPGDGAPVVKTFTDVFADAVIEAAKADPRVVAITAAMPTGTGLAKVEKQFPDRVFDVGICEQHAVTFAAGLATQGMKPICAIYSTFLQRGFDQFLHDVCLQNLPVVFAVDRAGAVGEDSPTQQGAFDGSFMRTVPNITIAAPRDDVDMRAFLHWSLKQTGPVALRYARSKAPTIGNSDGRDISRGEVLKTGSDATLLAVGPSVGECLKAAELLAKEGFSVGVADARFIKPLDTDLLEQLSHTAIVTVEENTLLGGFGSAVLEHFEAAGRLHDLRIRRIGFPDQFIPHATREEQLADIGLDAAGIARTVKGLLSSSFHEAVK
jgi:1-deoxy-D-xylulose-5-phosphate synthase